MKDAVSSNNRHPRRGWLKSAGLALASLPFLNRLSLAANDDATTKAKKNLQLGIMSNVYGSLPLQEAVKRIKADGFSNVVTDYAFADARFDMSNPDWETAKKIIAAFEKQEIQIAGVYGYYNIVSPNPSVRKQGEQRMEFFFANWKRLGCQVISTETGTLNAQSEWLISPENSTEEAYADCRRVLERLARAAEKTGAVLTIEPYWQNVIDSIDRADRLFRDIDSPSLQLVMDPCNYFRKEDLPKMQPMLEEMFKRLGSRIAIAHAKDVKASAAGTDLPAAGQGVLDYPLYLRLLASLNRKIPLVVEHLPLEDIARSRDFVLGQMEKI
ncbi:MAG: sugar phosphate isomerase/epimerase [Candidatus Omnitrophota bacterium]